MKSLKVEIEDEIWGIESGDVRLKLIILIRHFIDAKVEMNKYKN